MKKLSSYLSAAAAAVLALTMTACSADVDNPVGPEEPVVDNRIKTAEELIKAIEEGADGVEIELAANAEITLAEPLTLDKQVSIVGDEAAPANLKIAGVVTGKSFTIANANIDAAELATPLISLPAEAPEAWVEIPEIALVNTNIKGLGQAVIASAAKNFAITNFNITNSVIQVVKDVIVFDYTKGSVVLNQNIVNSTLYATAATSKSLYSSQSAQKATEFNGEAIQKFSFQNSTVYNFAVGKNFFTHRQSNQKWLAYDIQNSIFLDCGKKGQVVKGVNQGQQGANPTWTIAGNAFQFTVDGVITDTSAEESTGDNDEPVTGSLEGVVSFADAANGDFTQSTFKAGDPRWIK